MSIRARMIILPLSIVLHYCLTKTSNLTFIGFHNVLLQYCLMIVTMSMRAPSWHCDVRACAIKRFVPYPLHKFRLTSSFYYCGYGIIPSLRHSMSYSRNMSAYDLCISFPFFFVSTLWRHVFVPFSFVSTLYPVLSPSVSTLDSILSPPVSMLDLISSWFDLTLTTFPRPNNTS